MDRFFTVPADASAAIKAIARDLLLQNNEHHYLNNIIKKAGYPSGIRQELST